MIGADRDKKPAGGRSPAKPEGRDRLVLGFERIGLIALRAPIVSVIIVAAVCVFAAFGVAKLKVDDFAQFPFPFRHARVPAVRGPVAALSLARI